MSKKETLTSNQNPQEIMQGKYNLQNAPNQTDINAWNLYQKWLGTQNYNGKPVVANKFLDTPEGKKYSQGLMDKYNDQLVDQYSNSPQAANYKPIDQYLQNYTITPNHVKQIQNFHSGQTKKDDWVGYETSQLTYPNFNAAAPGYADSKGKVNLTKVQQANSSNSYLPVEGLDKKYVVPAVYDEKTGSPITDYSKAVIYDPKVHNILQDPTNTAYTNKLAKLGYTTQPVQAKAKGGPIKSNLADKFKVKGYDDGGPVMSPDGSTIADQGPSVSNFSASDVANDTYSNKFNTQKNTSNTSALVNQLASGINKSNPSQSNSSTQLGNDEYNTGKDAISSVPGIGTIIGAGMSVGDEIGKPMRDSAEAYDPTTGKYQNRTHAAVAGAFGGVANPYETLTTVMNDPDASTTDKLVTGLTGGAGFGFVSDDYYKNKEKARLKHISTTYDPKNGLYTTTNNNPAMKKGGLVQMCSEGGFIKAKGGLVEGIGGPKSDSISAKVKGNSFVVPAENVDVAKQIKKEVLGKNPNEKADLNQSNGENVKLSNTELIFTPSERYELLRKGIDVDALAPHAANSMSHHLVHGDIPNPYMQGCAQGGPIHIKKSHEGRFTDYANSHGMSVSEAANLIMKNKDNYSPHVVEMANFAKNAQGFQHKADGGGIDDLNDKLRKSKAEEDAKAAAETANSPFRNKPIPSYNDIINGKPTTSALVKKTSAIPLKTETVVPVKKSALVSKIAAPKYTTEPIEMKPYSNLAVNSTAPTYTGAPYVTTNSTDLINNGSVNPTTTKGNDFNYGTAIGLGQSALGLGLLLDKKNQRPVDSLAPAFQSQLAKSIAASNYGYTPEQKSLLNEQQIEGRNNALGAIYNAAGGNGAVALNNARQVFNDSYKNKLAAASDDEMLRLQKMGQANQMSEQDQEYRRRLFGDNMNKYLQNQGAYSNLLGAGLDNLIGSQRYNQQKQAQREIDKINAM